MSEQALWVAVIGQAIEDATCDPGQSQRRAQDQRDARAWLTVRNADFDRVCALAGLDPAYVRRLAAERMVQADARPPKPLSKRDRATLTFDGRTMTRAAWAAEIGLSEGTLAARIRSGWSLERALTEGCARGMGGQARKTFQNAPGPDRSPSRVSAPN